jgi:hypothetical protein
MSRKNKAPQEGLFPNGQPHEALDAVGSVGSTDQGEAAEPEQVHPQDLEFAVEELDGDESCRSTRRISNSPSRNWTGMSPHPPASLRLRESHRESRATTAARSSNPGPPPPRPRTLSTPARCGCRSPSGRPPGSRKRC